MTEYEYRTYRAYSVSDLNELDRLMKGELSWVTYWRARYSGIPYHITDPKILKFGTTLHQMVLEPSRELKDEWHSVEEWIQLHKMQAQLDYFIEQVFALYPCEVEGNRTCPNTGLILKGKVDCQTNDAVIDVKTTSCMNTKAFQKSFDKYGYWRQAAFYLHLTGANKFLFIGIGKKDPHPVFQVQADITAEPIQYGHKQVMALLRRAKLESEKPEGWLPSSWFRKKEVVV